MARNMFLREGTADLCTQCKVLIQYRRLSIWIWI